MKSSQERRKSGRNKGDGIVSGGGFLAEMEILWRFVVGKMGGLTDHRFTAPMRG
jgi:hypothetical protein